MFQLNPALRDFWATRKPYKLLKGGRFSSKTHDAAGIAAFLARNYSVRVMCVRQFQNRISDSVYTVVKEKIEAAGWEREFDIGVSSIQHKTTGSEFLFYGIARHLNEIKGTEGVDILWIEEGEGLTYNQWIVVDPTIRKEHAEIWILWNPQLATDFVQTKLPQILGDQCVIRHINYDENPFLSDTARRKADQLREVDYDLYRHVYLGEPLTNDDASVIKMAWINAAIDADVTLGIDLSGGRTVGYDVADSGADKNATACFDGAALDGLDEWAALEDELTQSTRRAWAHVKDGTMLYDSIGVGAHVGATLQDMGVDKGYYKFNAAGAVIGPEKEYAPGIKNKDKFENLKSQSWQDVADRFRNTFNAVTKDHEHNPEDLICIRSGNIPAEMLERLKTELAAPRRRYSKRGLDVIESKDELVKRGIPSPNLADAFIMGACPHLVERDNYTWSGF